MPRVRGKASKPRQEIPVSLNLPLKQGTLKMKKKSQKSHAGIIKRSQKDLTALYTILQGETVVQTRINQ